MKIRILAILLIIPFVAFTAYTTSIAEQSLLSFGYQLVSSPDTAQVVIDLYLMALLAMIWMYYDNVQQGKSVLYWLPFAVVTCIFVSVGPLLYLALRKENQSAPD